jgi:hypothetical protein
VVTIGEPDTKFVVGDDGVVLSTDQVAFNDHCLVMSGDRLVFDPGCSVKTPPGHRAMRCTPDDINYGISFTDLGKKD